ncbi:amidase-like [Mya arenaria]|uniref:amidase-like n=1 Tax=Mya arenaria TaxID=6604 RepID=UPI0022E641FB|nr:amidase-like [Mya arenaria]
MTDIDPTIAMPRNDSTKLPNVPKAARDMSSVSTEPPFKAFVANLPYDASEEKLMRFFGHLDVVNVRLPLDKGRHRGFGYVQFQSRQGLIGALGMHQEMFCGRKIVVHLTGESHNDNPSSDNPSSDNGKGGRYRYDGGPCRAAGDWRSQSKSDSAFTDRGNYGRSDDRRPIRNDNRGPSRYDDRGPRREGGTTARYNERGFGGDRRSDRGDYEGFGHHDDHVFGEGIYRSDDDRRGGFEGGGNRDEPEMYRAPAVRPPSTKELAEMGESLGYQLTDAEIEGFKGHIMESLKLYNDIEGLVPPTLPVKYPRTPGYRPEPSENSCNAWYWKCDIKGASSGLLKGKRVGIKDNVCVAGVPMMNGSKVMQGYTPEVDATLVTRILDAGGQVIGKTNCESMCFSGSSFTNDTGPTLNPKDQERSAGGSSGGSAAVVKNGEADVAIGGDQGGSIRIPSSWVGIVGLKPTWGLVPYTGVVPIETTVDHAGPMAASVTDCALLLEAIAGYDDGRDPRQESAMTCPPYSKQLEVSLAGKKIGLLTEGFDGCEEDVQMIVRAAADRFKSINVEVEDVSMPLHTHGVAIWAPICTDGAYQCMIRGFGGGYQNKGLYNESLMTKLREGYAGNARNVSDPVKMVTMIGTYMEKNYGAHYYARAQNLNWKLTKTYDELLEKYDVIIMPTLPYKAPLLPKTTWSLQDRMKNALGMVKNTAPFDITGHPALTINAGMSEGLPIGLQIVGKRFDDVKVLQFARAFEKLQ